MGFKARPDLLKDARGDRVQDWLRLVSAAVAAKTASEIRSLLDTMNANQWPLIIDVPDNDSPDLEAALAAFNQRRAGADGELASALGMLADAIYST